MNLDQIPGYDRAARRAGRLEDSWRAFPFLGITERILGVEINLLTLRMFIQLCAARSPFFIGGRIRPEDIAVILWRLSPNYERPETNQENRNAGKTQKQKSYVPGRKGSSFPNSQSSSPRERFIKSILLLPYDRTRRAINRFLDRMLIDKPPSTGSVESVADVCLAASFIHQLASAYGWSQDAILDLPMPALFQYVRDIQRDKAAAAGQSRPKFNPLRSRLTKRIIDKAIEPKDFAQSPPRKQRVDKAKKTPRAVVNLRARRVRK